MEFSTEYQFAYECVGGEKPGARAMQDFLLEHIGALPGCETVDSGIYNCRPIRGGRGMSTHSEGRAMDTGVRLPGGWWPREEIPEPGIREWADRLIDNASQLGILYIIYARRSRRPGAPWKPYRGTSPHWDHLHIEMSREAAEVVTRPYIESVLLDTEDGTAMSITEYINLMYWVKGGQIKPDYPGLMFWLNEFSEELSDKLSYSRDMLEGTDASRNMIYGLENPG